MSKPKGHEPTPARDDVSNPEATDPVAAGPVTGAVPKNASESAGTPGPSANVAEVRDFTDFRELAAAERRAREQITKLQAVTAALSEAILPVDVAHVVAHEMTAALGASTAVLAVPAQDGTHLTVLGSSGLQPESATRYATVPVETDFPITAAFRAGQPIWLASRAELFERHPRLPNPAEVRSEAFACVPLQVKGSPLGAIGFGFSEPRVFDDAERALIEDLARQAALALERARLYEAEQTARDRATFMAEASRVLATSLDVQATLSEIARLAVPAMADWSSVELAAPDGAGESKQLAIVHVAPEKVALAHRLNQQYPPDPDAPYGVPHVLRTGVSELYETIPDELLVQVARDAEHLRIARELGLKSAMTVAIRFQDRVLGTISFVSAESGRRYTRSDLEMAEELGRRAGLALENARLYEAERRARKDEVAARQQAEAATQAREEILAVVSHDLRNPLNAILMSATNLRGLQLADKQAQRVRTNSERIERAAKRMARLIGDLVDFASIQSGQLAIQKTSTHVSEILDATFEMFAGPAEERGLALDRQVAGELAPVDCDRDRIVQVLANLLSNAVKVTAPGGRVTVGVERRDAETVFLVRDTGPGIGEDELAQVFERYWRSKKVAYKGSGLGLTIAKGIIDAHHGRIWVESALGVGSTFYFSLPAAPATGS